MKYLIVFQKIKKMLTSKEFKEIFQEFRDKISKTQNERNEFLENNCELKDNISSEKIRCEISEKSDKTIREQLLEEKVNNDEFKILFSLKNFFADKFSEATKIFNSFNSEGFRIFIRKCEYTIYNEKDTILEKGIDCNHYYFLVFGDIVFYSENIDDPNTKLQKTISGGVIFGHKIKEKLQYFAYAQSGSVQLIKILKIDFDEIIDSLNEQKNYEKVNFLKKYFPKFRTYPEDSIKKFKEFFFKFEYTKGSKIFLDGELDDYVYIIKNGSCVATKKVKRINGLKEYLQENGQPNKTHIALENYGKHLYISFI